MQWPTFESPWGASRFGVGPPWYHEVRYGPGKQR